MSGQNYLIQFKMSHPNQEYTIKFSPRIVDASEKANFKVALIGFGPCGKTSIIERFVNNEFHVGTPTVGVSFISKSFSCENGEFILRIIDTCGAERFIGIQYDYCKKIKHIIIVLDASSNEWKSFLLKMISDFQNKQITSTIYIAVNKIDLEKENCIQMDELEQIAAECHCRKLFKVSAKTGASIEEMFTQITNDLLNDGPENDESENDSKGDTKNDKTCQIY